MPISQLIDTLILLLLAGTLGYAYFVDRRLRRLMSALAELGPMVGQFSDAVDKSQTSVSALKEATDAAQSQARRPVGHRIGAVSKRVAAKQAAPQPQAQARAKPEAPARAAPQPARPAAKSDLVRQFFDTTRRSEA
ncbi:flagellar motor switch protein [Oceanicola granulosus HTCC2516]|uniref:Flagellar motor switch protein n=1 Tax=Oceanicola granulosus (strain ATCC BAA-861 / DSM 15982 / KCTC 12143 / HTCC2516) TaxID=314256 RepID=Q2CGI3_OCEGH|nr:hypothetical protein [Oceanicola granulosus]EAR51735.1 flagellar motor switch protein [Oceanicola granulosus HTCC2516]